MTEGNLKKRLYSFESWNPLIKMSIPVENVDKVKVRWLHYETQSAGDITAAEYKPPQNKKNKCSGYVTINNTIYGIVGDEIVNNVRIISAY